MTCVHFNVNTYSPLSFNDYEIKQPDDLSTWSKKRQCEFLAGRVAAQESLRKLADIRDQITIGAKRQPLWPLGYTGSISHTNDNAIAVSSNSNQCLGVDLETVIQDFSLFHSFLSDSEMTLLAKTPIASFPVLATAAFSAKESFFKAAFPIIRRFFDFDQLVLKSVSHFDLTFQIQPLVHYWLKQEEVSDTVRISFRFLPNPSKTPIIVTFCRL
jgi:4'-phosphopantetheinyl transferase EntD